MKKKQMTIPIFVPHQGCPHQCAFCNQKHISGEYNLPQRVEIKSKIESYLESKSDRIDYIEIAFFGGSFTGINEKTQREFLDIAFDYKSRGKIQAIRLSTRPDYINKEKIKLEKMEKKKFSVVKSG